MFGIKTIGNATLVAFDDVPVLATDPWLGGDDHAYFGSWNLAHAMPAAVRSEILSARYVWLSHGHPDHLNGTSVGNLRSATLLLPDHVGGRIADDLVASGFTVRVLPDRQWVELSPRVRVCCITTVVQDAILLIDVNGRLFVNLNDAGVLGSSRFIREVTSGYRDSYLLAVACSDADMLNFVDEAGQRTALAAPSHTPPGAYLSRLAGSLGIANIIPFSSFHRYQRSDSVWANGLTTGVAEYPVGPNRQGQHFLPAYVWVDCETGEYQSLQPAAADAVELAPETFGDNWSEPLEVGDWKAIESYIRERETLAGHFGFIGFRVGGKDHFVRLNGPKERGLQFEAPRNSLMTAVQHEIFDDLLIGNFVRTRLFGVKSLYDPNFNFIVAKYGDNGRAKTVAEVEHYLSVYRQRAGLRQTLLDQFNGGARRALHRALNPALFRRLKAVYYRVG